MSDKLWIKSNQDVIITHAGSPVINLKFAKGEGLLVRKEVADFLIKKNGFKICERRKKNDISKSNKNIINK